MPKRKCSNIDKSVGERMKEFRKSCNLTQQQIADILNINRTTYTKYETGVSEPSHDLLGKIVDIFGVDYNSILGGTDYFESKVADEGFSMSSLSTTERDLIAGYRTLPKEEQEKISDNVKNVVLDRRKKFL